MNQAVEFRSRAQQCVASAREAHTVVGRACFLEMARVWTQLADEDEQLGHITEALAAPG